LIAPASAPVEQLLGRAPPPGLFGALQVELELEQQPAAGGEPDGQGGGDVSGALEEARSLIRQRERPPADPDRQGRARHTLAAASKRFAFARR
jgi:hypothetical protein